MYAAWRPFFCQCKYLLKAAEAGTKNRPWQIWHIPLRSARSPKLCKRKNEGEEGEERANSAFMDMDDAGLSVRGAICGRTHHPHPGGQAEPRRSASNENGAQSRAEKIIGSERVKNLTS